MEADGLNRNRVRIKTSIVLTHNLLHYACVNLSLPFDGWDGEGGCYDP